MNSVRCDWCGVPFMSASDITDHYCAAMQQAEDEKQDGVKATLRSIAIKFRSPTAGMMALILNEVSPGVPQ